MLGRFTFTCLALTAASCTAVAVASPAQADASTTVTPAGAAVSAVNQGPLTFAAGEVTGSCNTVNANGSVPAAPGNQNASGPVSVQIGSPTIGDCSSSLPVTIAVSTSGTWGVQVQYGSTITGSLTIPQGGMVIQGSGLANCTTVVAPDGPVTLSGTFTNGNPPTVTIDNVSAPIRTTGDPICPTDATTGSVSGTLVLNNTTDPSQPITVGP
ncbi:hypothetical protein [Nocardia arthritidis]|uniref:Protein activator of alkane oxidation PraB n=1 Tax=Nocardia arthritidis TaxID=228602 RepID=A0A6G9YE46_9NOCA|nr:hypothetical protein [Nocardia arthritidis]QIS11458.1 hypothetical protein F5544_17920 [Nocardia arthritidis]